jgi:hypothetical protein
MILFIKLLLSHESFTAAIPFGAAGRRSCNPLDSQNKPSFSPEHRHDV